MEKSIEGVNARAASLLEFREKKQEKTNCNCKIDSGDLGNLSKSCNNEKN